MFNKNMKQDFNIFFIFFLTCNFPHSPPNEVTKLIKINIFKMEIG